MNSNEIKILMLLEKHYCFSIGDEYIQVREAGIRYSEYREVLLSLENKGLTESRTTWQHEPRMKPREVTTFSLTDKGQDMVATFTNNPMTD